MAFSIKDFDNKLRECRERYNRDKRETKMLYGETSKKTKEFLQSTKEMRLKIEKQLETMDDNDSGNMQVLTNCLQDRIRQCDETLNNLLQLKERILSKPVFNQEILNAMRVELPFPAEARSCDNSLCYNEPTSSSSPASIYDHYEALASNCFSYCNNTSSRFRLPAAYEYNPDLYQNDNRYDFGSGSPCDFRSHEDSDDEAKPRVTGFTRYPAVGESQFTLNADSKQYQVTGFTKFCSNIEELQQILDENRKGREQHMKRIEEFCKGKPTGECKPKCPPQDIICQPECTPQTIHPICCGPSKLRPIFDTKIQKLEQEIVKHCFEIKEKNILIEQSMRAKEVLMCQKHNLHNILLKLCEKIKQLEKKLYRIKMAVCCPSFPIEQCSTNISCREEIKNLKKLEDKLETLYNGAKHKQCLLLICQKSVGVLKKDKKEWEKNIEDMKKIRADLQNQLEAMKNKVCKRNLTSEQTKPPTHTLPKAEQSYSSQKVRKSRVAADETEESSVLNDFVSQDLSERRSRRSRQRINTCLKHRCAKGCKCK